MFGSLIRRKQTKRPLGEDNIAFESTTFTLSTSVPRPSDRRSDERMIAMLRVAKLTDAHGHHQLIRVRNVSAGGLMAEIGHPVTVGDLVEVELSSQKIASSVIWTRDGTAGFKFEQNIDLGELLAGRKPRHGFRPRPPRLEVNCKANVQVAESYYTVEVHDISLGGMK
ncbi:MAG TPA: PilZ domain-containing protein, partial [Sphingomicrobium sp.]